MRLRIQIRNPPRDGLAQTIKTGLELAIRPDERPPQTTFIGRYQALLHGVQNVKFLESGQITLTLP